MSAAPQAIPARPVSAQKEDQNFGLDFWLLGAVLTLLSIGLVMVYSTTVATGEFAGSTHYLFLQSAYIAFGLFLMWLVSRIESDWWRGASHLLLIVAGILLLLVLIPGIGVEVNGSRRWLPLGPVRMQASEIAKMCVLIYAADYLARKSETLQKFKDGIVNLSIIIGVASIMMLLEPDLGSTVVLAATIFGMMFLAGVRITHFGFCVLIGVALVALLTIVSPYRMQRVVSFLRPFDDPFNSGFQLVQALIALGRGEWFGVGLGGSIQKLFYLPHASTDFILAVLGEELGLIGVTAVIVLFGVILWRAFAIARRADISGKHFAARVAQGIGILLALQATINMGVNLGMLPTKGLTLPFMSYGGSSMLMSCLAIGLLLRIHTETLPRSGGKR